MKKIMTACAAALAAVLLPLCSLAASVPAVPDPADFTGGERVTVAEDADLGDGYICDAYAYEMPEDMNAFASAYITEAQARGFAVTKGTALRQQAVFLTAESGSFAVLIPEYEDGMLLMVPKGMALGEPEHTSAFDAFDALISGGGGFSMDGGGGQQETPQTQQEEAFYLTFARNGRTMSAEFDGRKASCEAGRRMNGTAHTFDIVHYFKRQPITLFHISFPNYAQAGDEFYVTRDKLINGLYLYTSEEGSLVFYDSPYHHQMSGRKDYFRVRITGSYDNGDGLVLEGEFDGSFNNGETVYSDGRFRVLCLD